MTILSLFLHTFIWVTSTVVALYISVPEPLRLNCKETLPNGRVAKGAMAEPVRIESCAPCTKATIHSVVDMI